MPSLLIATGVPLRPIAASRSTRWYWRAGSAAAAAEIAATSATIRAQPALDLFQDQPSQIEWQFISTPSAVSSGLAPRPGDSDDGGIGHSNRLPTSAASVRAAD